MNYFAHGIRYLDQPYFLAGTAVPDWLSVADRKVRMRSKRAEPFNDGTDAIESQIARGVLQHLHDDGWFHETRAFLETTAQLGRQFREVLGTDDGFRAGFLGHIVTELLLDGVLIEKHPNAIDDYYNSMQEIEPGLIQQSVNQMAKFQTERLTHFIGLFQQEQFLRDYVDPTRLLVRLNQVMRRIKLPLLPDITERILISGWDLVRNNADELLPTDHFQSGFSAG
jgi:hypothetical protein